MSPQKEDVAEAVTEKKSPQNRRFTIPDAICVLRLLGSLALPGVAATGNSELFACFFATLSLSDWIDGKLARWLNQQSVFGARLDSLADSVLYAGFFAGTAILMGDAVRAESVWWGTALTSYVVTTVAGLCKYGRIPSYHTRGAKISYWLILAGGLCLVLGYSVWPFRLAMLSVTITNIEAAFITWYLPKWTSDVRSFREAMKKMPRSEDVPRS